jgi:hypothetical protein
VILHIEEAAGQQARVFLVLVFVIDVCIAFRCSSSGGTEVAVVEFRIDARRRRQHEERFVRARGGG